MKSINFQLKIIIYNNLMYHIIMIQLFQLNVYNFHNIKY